MSEEKLPTELHEDVDPERLKKEAVVPNCTFNGNPLLKRDNVSIGLTEWHLEEIARCMKDPCYFAENYMKVVHVDKGLIPIKLYDYQKKMLKAMDEHRYSIILSCRQSGKCVVDKTKTIVRHPEINGGEPFVATVAEVAELAKKLAISKEPDSTF